MGASLVLVGVILTLLAGPAWAAEPGEMERKRAAEVGLQPGAVLQPGTVLDAKNASAAEGLMPPEVLRHYREGEYRNEIVDYPLGVSNYGPDFEAETKRNAERLDVNDAGTVIDKTTGKQPAYIYGTPFPKIDPKDPKAGVKVIWNFFYNYWWNGNSRNVVDLLWLQPKGLDRKAGQDVFFKYYDGLPSDFRPANNPNNFLMQFIATTLDPIDLYGTTALSWRYRDAGKRDSIWAYVPALRRIRALSPANRSDGFLGSDMSQDDGPFFDGKPEDFTFKLIGEEETLRLIDPFRLAGDYTTVTLPDGGFRGILKSVPYYGYQEQGWTGVAWAPAGLKLARRKVWVVEVKPKDSYYLYGKVELRFDQETWQGTYSRKFSWQGELLNTLQTTGGPARPTPDGKYFLSVGVGGGAAAIIAENIKMNRATVAGLLPRPEVPQDRHLPIAPEFFDYQTLYRFGK